MVEEIQNLKAQLQQAKSGKKVDEIPAKNVQLELMSKASAEIESLRKEKQQLSEHLSALTAQNMQVTEQIKEKDAELAQCKKKMEEQSTNNENERKYLFRI